MTKKVKWIIAAVVAGLLVMAITIPALAAGPTGTPNPTNTGGPGWGNGGGPGSMMDDVITKLLGMTAEQIQEQRQAGKSLAQIAATKNISEDTLINTILAERKADLQKLVDAKTLTQDQANQRLEFMKTQIKQMVERTTVGPPAGRGMMGRSGWNGGNSNGTVTPGTCPCGGGIMRFGRTTR